MKCKHCQAELEEGVTLCPECGTENAEAPAEAVEETAEVAAEEIESEEIAAEDAETEETEAEEKTEPAEEKKLSEIQEGVKATPGKIAIAVAAVVVLVAVLAALIITGIASWAKDTPETEPTTEVSATDPTVEIPTTEATIPADGNPDDVTCKGSYTASDADVLAAADTVVATVGDKTLTVKELQVYYWMQAQQFMNSESGYYAYYMGGIDMTQPLDTQVSLMDQGLTWQQYFLREALSAWHTYQVMASEADASDFEMDEEIRKELESIPDSLLATATNAGFADVEALIQHNFGAAATLEDYLAFSELYYKGYDYYDAKSIELTPTDDEITAYFDEHAEDYLESGISKETKTVDVRHILIMPEGATNETVRTETFPEEAWEAAQTQAQAILDGYLAGEKTEENFGLLATQHTQDPGSAETGGLYTGVNQGDMVEAFDAWCFDAARQPGDTGIVKTEFGYHIMYYVGSNTLWQEYAKNDLLAERSNKLLEDASAKYPIEVDYSAIVLGIPPMFEQTEAE